MERLGPVTIETNSRDRRVFRRINGAAKRYGLRPPRLRMIPPDELDLEARHYRRLVQEILKDETIPHNERLVAALALENLAGRLLKIASLGKSVDRQRAEALLPHLGPGARLKKETRRGDGK